MQHEVGRALSESVDKWKLAAIGEGTFKTYGKNFRHWIAFTISIQLPTIFLDELSPSDQSTVMAWFAVACGEHGHNAKNEGNQFATYKVKKSAVVWAHKYYRNTILELKGATLSLIEACYRRTLNVPHPKQPFYASMLPGCATEFRSWPKAEGELAWGCLLLQFFYLGRAGEIWDTGGQAEYAMPASNLESQSRSDHRIQVGDVVLRDKFGNSLSEREYHQAVTVTVTFNHAKADQVGRGDTITMGESGHRSICPVKGAIMALRARRAWKTTYKDNALSGGIKASRINSVIKKAAASAGKDPNEYALHSVRIGYATMLFEVGYDELVIRLAGRWSSEVVALYTRISGRVLLSAPRDVMASVQPYDYGVCVLIGWDLIMTNRMVLEFAYI